MPLLRKVVLLCASPIIPNLFLFPMATIKEDIITFSDMIVRGFSVDKLNLDFTLTSFKDIDKFYDLHSRNGQVVENGRFSNNLGQILFSLGAYVGQTIIKIVPGTTGKPMNKIRLERLMQFSNFRMEHKSGRCKEQSKDLETEQRTEFTFMDIILSNNM